MFGIYLILIGVIDVFNFGMLYLSYFFLSGMVHLYICYFLVIFSEKKTLQKTVFSLWKKVCRLEKKYTTAGCIGCDKYEVCTRLFAALQDTLLQTARASNR